ncbi:polysaccharide biosynthesis tyrosine autokinase [Rhodoferax koreense]|nr:polysaccharide biosynthesis tyrosine autokinase [Rhodoferax koreense]
MDMKPPHIALEPMGVPTPRRSTRFIGEILVEAGYLDAEASERIAQAQRQNGLSFGDAAVKLKLLSRADIEFALAQQFEYPYLHATNESVSPSVVLAFRPSDPFAEQMRSLRTQLVMQRAANTSVPSSFAILSAQSGEGRSMVAANLAVAFSQMGERTLLIDADMRSASQHKLFNLSSRNGLSNMLLGRAGPECISKVPHFFDLSVLTAGSVPPNPQELLTRARMTTILAEAAKTFDVVVLDTPPAAEFADAQIIASRTGGGVLVTRAAKTNARVLNRVLTAFKDCGTNLVGTVLNLA